MNEFQANRDFEQALCDYTGAPYAIALDNCCNAIFLCLRWLYHYDARNYVHIPKATFIGVPYAIRAAGFEPLPDPDFAQEHAFDDSYYLEGYYTIGDLPVWDSALHLTSGMYRPGSYMCLSFTGPYKHLRIGKGGAILLDDPEAEAWLRRASYCGRNYVSYHEDSFELREGYNMYMHPSTAILGLQLIKGLAKDNQPLRLPYPDWSTHKAFSHAQTT